MVLNPFIITMYYLTKNDHTLELFPISVQGGQIYSSIFEDDSDSYRINDVFEQQFKHTKRQRQKGKSFLEHPPKEVGIRPHSMKAKT